MTAACHAKVTGPRPSTIDCSEEEEKEEEGVVVVVVVVVVVTRRVTAATKKITITIRAMRGIIRVNSVSEARH